MNPVLSQIPKAQEAFTQATSSWDNVDTTDLLLAANTAIKQAIDAGGLICQIGNITDIKLAEKAALELQELGYNTSVVSGGMAMDGQGGYKPISVLVINWKWMPSNSRDRYTV